MSQDHAVAESDYLDVKPLDANQIVSLCSRLLKKNKKMRELPLTYFIEVLAKAGKNWLDPHYPYRAKAIEILSSTTGQCPSLIAEEMNMSFRFWHKDILYKVIESEMAIPEIIDEFAPMGDLRVRRWPYGLAIFNLSGNVFMVSPFIIALGLLSKNCVLMRVSSREPYFANYLVQSLIEISPEMENFFEVAYWERDTWESFLPELPAQNIVIFHLGGEASCRYIREITARMNIRSVIHGPAWGLVVLEKTKRAYAHGIGYDVVFWEQRACHSPRLVLVRGDHRKFAIWLAEALNELNQTFPKVFTEAGTVNHLLARQRFLVSCDVQLYSPSDTSFTVIASSDKPKREDFPYLTDRFVWVSPIDHLGKVTDYLEKEGLAPHLQTVAYDGNNEAFIKHITSLGVSRLTPPGKMNQFLPGTSHDGVYNMSLLTRVSTVS